MRLSLPLLLSTLATPVLAAPPRVVADLPAVHSLAAQVMAGLGEPAILLDRGADPHNVQLRPSQAQLLAEADLLFWIGPELTPWLVRAIDGFGIRSEAIALLQATGVHLQDFGDAHDHGGQGHEASHGSHDDHEHDHDHDHDHDHANDDDEHDHHHAEEGHGHDDHAHDDHGHDDHAGDDHGHSHDGTDPHAWLDPHNARIWVDLIAAELAGHDPANADAYAANAATARDRIAAVEAEVREILAPVGDAPIFVFHDAYGYFASHFGLDIAGSIALGDAADPGAGRLGEIRAMLADEGAVCVFPEAQHDMRYVDLVVEGTGVRVGAPLDPSGTTLDHGPDLYAALLRNLAQDIADCVAG